jgi:hypothetical protein
MDSPSSVAEWPFRPLGFVPMTSVGVGVTRGASRYTEMSQKTMPWEVKETGKIIEIWRFPKISRIEMDRNGYYLETSKNWKSIDRNLEVSQF